MWQARPESNGHREERAQASRQGSDATAYSGTVILCRPPLCLQAQARRVRGGEGWRAEHQYDTGPPSYRDPHMSYFNSV